MTVNVTEMIRKMMGWCPNVSIAERKTKYVEYEPASVTPGLSVKKWKFDLLILGHVCVLLFASLFILPMSMYQIFDLYNSPNLALNLGQFLTNITLSIASALFSIATIILIYNITVYKKLYSKLCYFNAILLSGLFAAIILQLFFYGDYRLEWSIYWAFVLALLPSIPSIMSIRLDKRYGNQKVVTEGIGLSEIIKRALGWCPNAAILNKKEEIYMVSYEGKYIDKIKGMGFRGFLGVLHLVFGVWLISTALWVLAKREIFPWWGMEINIISSGILLAIGLSSLIIFFNFVRSANVHRILASVNLALLAGFFLYLGQFLVSSEFSYLSMFFVKLYNYYSFGLVTLSLFTLIVAVPNVLTFFSKPVGEKKKGFLTATLLVLIVVFASLGAYYLYLSKQKNSMLTEEFGDIKLYKMEPGASSGALFGMWSTYPYVIDSPGDTTGHPISKETYEAMQFLKNKEGGKVLSWWDFELEIKAAGKEPVISYASEAIKTTIARPASLYDKFEPDEKVADVSRFFATDSEDVSKGIAEKYGADMVYISRQRMNDLIPVMIFAAGINIYAPPEEYSDKVIKPTMGYKFNSGAELKYFEKIFENKDVIIYQLKK